MPAPSPCILAPGAKSCDHPESPGLEANYFCKSSDTSQVTSSQCQHLRQQAVTRDPVSGIASEVLRAADTPEPPSRRPFPRGLPLPPALGTGDECGLWPQSPGGEHPTPFPGLSTWLGKFFNVPICKTGQRMLCRPTYFSRVL